MNQVRILGAVVCLAVLCGACNSGMQLYKKGNKRFSSGEYQVAIGQYEKAVAKNFSPLLTNRALAESYRLSDRPQKAADYYQKALEAGAKEDTLYYHYAFALKSLGKYPEAAEQFDQFLRLNSDQLVYVARAKKEIDNLKKVQEIAAVKTYYEIQNVSALNTQASEFAPVYKNDELIFTSSRKAVTYKANGQGMLGCMRLNLARIA